MTAQLFLLWFCLLRLHDLVGNLSRNHTRILDSWNFGFMYFLYVSRSQVFSVAFMRTLSLKLNSVPSNLHRERKKLAQDRAAL